MKQIESLLGLAAKAGNLVAGSAAVEAALKKGRVELVICTADLSEKTIQNYRFWCQTKGVKFYCFGNRENLGRMIGRPGRGVIGITSKNFAVGITALLKDGGDLP